MTSYIARTPVDLLAVVPFALGFHPEDSVVLLTFGGETSGPGSFQARVDLPVVADEQTEVAAMLRAMVGRHRAERIGVLIYTEDAGAAKAFHDSLVPGLLVDGVEIVDVLRVGSSRFHAADDPFDPGTPYDLDAHPFTAAQVVEGRVAFDSRSALAETLIGNDADDVDTIAAEADRFADGLILIGSRAPRSRGGARRPLARALGTELREQARWLQARIRERQATPRRDGMPGPSGLTAQDCARMLVLVALDALREVALAEMTRPTAVGHLELWRELSRRSPRDLRAAPAALCAFAAWLHGDGALAWCALDRCFEVDPDDSLGHQVAALLESATPPTVWKPMVPTDLRVFGERAAASG